MQNPPQFVCPPRFDVAAYLDGRTYAEQKARLEQHLCVCDDCFETLINVLNLELDQADSRGLDSAGKREEHGR